MIGSAKKIGKPGKKNFRITDELITSQGGFVLTGVQTADVSRDFNITNLTGLQLSDVRTIFIRYILCDTSVQFFQVDDKFYVAYRKRAGLSFVDIFRSGNQGSGTKFFNQNFYNTLVDFSDDEGGDFVFSVRNGATGGYTNANFNARIKLWVIPE